MDRRRLDEAGRRELVRLMAEDGLSPRAAAARPGVSESTARRWRARAAADEPASGAAADPALVLADRSVRQAEAMMASLLAPVPARTRRPPPPRRISPPAPAGPARRPSGGSDTWRRARRRLAGVGLTVAFVPVGWVASAAVMPDDTAGRRAAPSERASSGRSVTFSPELARSVGGVPTSLVARARRTSIRIHRRPGGRRPTTLRAREIEGRRIPLVMLVDRRRGRWIRVHLPVRPNGSLGWVRARSVRLRANPYRLRVELGRHRLTVWRGEDVIARRRIGVGQALSPTPTGRYFLTDLIRTRDPGGFYGPYAFGLSAFSPVYTAFRGGPGQIGLHGTDAPGRLGTDISAGCIRVTNSTIRRLARILPLGTPIVIRR